MIVLFCSRGRHCLHIRLCTRWHSPATGMLFFFPGGIIIYSSRFILLGVSPSRYTGPAVFALSLQLWSRFINTTLRHTKRCNMDAHACSYSDMNYFPSWRRMWGGVVLFVFPDQLATKRSWSVVIGGHLVSGHSVTFQNRAHLLPVRLSLINNNSVIKVRFSWCNPLVRSQAWLTPFISAFICAALMFQWIM